MPCLEETTSAGSLDRGGPPRGQSRNNCQKVHVATSSVGCGDAFTPSVYSAVASLQACFAFLLGQRVGEASNPGPLVARDSPACQDKRDPCRGVRVGEAKNPGLPPLALNLKA